MRIAIDLHPLAFESPRGFSLWVVAQLAPTVGVNRAYIRRGLLPSLYSSGVRYEREETESFADGLVVYERGYGDCAHLACWRIAELREAGEHARFILSWRTKPDGSRGYHVKVRRANMAEEDPSRILGM